MNRAKVEDALLAMGVPAGIKGFAYIADAVCILDKNFNLSITKELYPEIAEMHDTTASRVERAIRHAFEVARSAKGDKEVVNHYIGFINRENSSSLKKLCMMLKREES